jgi:hypothetical protein
MVFFWHSSSRHDCHFFFLNYPSSLCRCPLFLSVSPLSVDVSISSFPLCRCPPLSRATSLSLELSFSLSSYPPFLSSPLYRSSLTLKALRERSNIFLTGIRSKAKFGTRLLGGKTLRRNVLRRKNAEDEVTRREMAED